MSNFFHTWTKYIPIIRILLKRSPREDQKLELNSIDFIRATGGRKVKFDFSFSLLNGKLENLELPTPLGRGLIDALHDDKVCKQLVKTSRLQFSLSKNFELTIKNTTPAAEPQEATQ